MTIGALLSFLACFACASPMLRQTAIALSKSGCSNPIFAATVCSEWANLGCPGEDACIAMKINAIARDRNSESTDSKSNAVKPVVAKSDFLASPKYTVEDCFQKCGNWANLGCPGKKACSEFHDFGSASSEDDFDDLLERKFDP